MPRIVSILPLLLAVPLRAAAQDGLESRNEAFLRAVTQAPRDSVAAFFPRRGDWTWTQVAEGAPPGYRPKVWRFAATQTLRAIGRGGPACGSFLQLSGGVGAIETVLIMRINRGGVRWRRVAGNRFVPPGESAPSRVFVQWRREDGRWVVSAFGDETYWFPHVPGEFRGGDAVRDTVRRLPSIPVYAAEAPWYLDGRPITFEGYRYTRYGRPRAIADSLLTRVGRFGPIGVYTAKGDDDAEILYIPVAPGEYQPYQAGHGRVHPCR
ncbi:MAG: hypothetical protein ACJ8GN_00380 [Longimicrobiaceae bacterium]